MGENEHIYGYVTILAPYFKALKTSSYQPGTTELILVPAT